MEQELSMARQMRAYILDVASTLFASRGINATSVDTIVAEAGIAKVTLYKYFKSKEQLILEYLREYDDRLWRMITERMSDPEATTRERLQALVDALLDWIADPAFQGFAFVKASVEFPRHEDPVHKSSLQFAQSLRQTLTHLAREARARDPEALALQLAMVIEGAAITENMQRDASAVAHARDMAKILIDAAT